MTETSASRPPVHPPTETTIRANLAARERLPAETGEDFRDATRGLLGGLTEPIVTPTGTTVWDPKRWDFLEPEDSPNSVHPSLWRQARLNRIHGLFEVADGLYQARGYDIANITFVEGKSGVVVVDALTTREAAEATLRLYRKHRGNRPVRAVVFTHSHADHFGGVRGIVDEAAVLNGSVEIIAPSGFLRESVGENVLAGPAMARRALYQFGQELPANELGTVDAGLGKASTGGTITLLAPTREVTSENETIALDGIEFVFQLAPESEAPAEMHFWLPRWKALNTAENATHTLHNLLPLRGAKARDAKAWSQYLHVALERWGRQAEIVFAQHHWPIWGNSGVVHFLSVQRDAYRFLHDQTLRLANRGLVPGEIAEKLGFPEELEREWSVRGLYGSVKHNAKAVYQRYLGWYDGHPSRLDPLPPEESARRWVDYAGGAEALLEKARRDFDAGEYRWVAEALDKLTLAQPKNAEAVELLARAFEQLGYQSESSTWRNAYLQGALELRRGPRETVGLRLGEELSKALTASDLFDALATRLNPTRIQRPILRLNWRFTDVARDHLVQVERATLTHLPGVRASDASATIELSQSTFRDLLLRRIEFLPALTEGKIRFEGDPGVLREFFGLFEEVTATFPIVGERPTK
jgi:alkyl sulfatase BDS1-like metallo-beta-lactamase superfamily hydrolase